MLDQTHSNDEQLNEYLEGFLSEASRIVLELHLETCDLCAARLEELRSFIQELEALPDLPLERDLAPSVLAAIQPAARTAPQMAVSLTFRIVLLSQVVIALILFLFSWPIIADRLPLSIAAWFGEHASDQFMLQIDSWQSVLLALWENAGGFLNNIIASRNQLMLQSILFQASIFQIVILLSAATLLWLAGNQIMLRSRGTGNHRHDR